MRAYSITATAHRRRLRTRTPHLGAVWPGLGHTRDRAVAGFRLARRVHQLAPTGGFVAGLRGEAARVAAVGGEMEPFFLAQALVEHGALSSFSAGLDAARNELSIFVESLDATKLLIGLGIIAFVMILWRR